MANVSICIPTYNRKRYLEEAVQSCFAQTYKDYEVVIVDDGSADGTEEMIKNYGRKVRYYWQENAGDAAARNKLIELAKGQYVTFLDSDDLLVPDALERMVMAAESESEPVVVYGPYIRIDEHGNVTGRCKRKLRTGFITRYLFEDILVHSCGSMFPARLLRSEGGFDTSLPVCSDYDLWLRLSTKYRFIALKEPTFKRRRHSANFSVASAVNRIKELDVLRCFYYEKGGSSAVPRRVAMRRLSREAYRVAKCAVAEGNSRIAREYLHKSLEFRTGLRPLVLLSAMLLKQKLGI
ncbi:MAG: glycosyltransferase [Planctomycetota bacterium]